MSGEIALVSAIAVGIGLIAGIAHFRSLELVARHFADGRMGSAIGLQIFRLVALGGALFLAAWLGALPLLAGAAGFLFARSLILRGRGALP